MPEIIEIPALENGRDTGLQGLSDYCDITNIHLAANSSPVRLAVASVVTYQVVGVRCEELEAFNTLSDAEKNAYYQRYRTYTSAMFNGEGAALSYPSVNL